MSFLLVGCGGAVGAVLRYALSLIPIRTEFPLMTFVTNLIGALVIGFITGFSMRPGLMLFLKTGICGGFTTFSTFSLETWELLENKSYLTGCSYAALSLLCCLAGIWCGRKLAAACSKI
jgi:CrcB protein